MGSEDRDVVTKNYNETMEKILPEYGLEVVEIPRTSLDNQIISASKVRTLLKERKFEEAYKFLPEATIKALKSEGGHRIINDRL